MPDANALSFEQQVAMFRATASDPQARMEFAASRAAVINPLLNEQSTVRAIFTPEQLAPGASARYDVPFEDSECVWMMPNIGGIPTVQVEGAEFYVDTFGIDGGIEYQMDIARDGRFQVAQRATTMLANRFIRQEEMCGWALIKSHEAALPASQKLQAFTDAGVQTAGSGKMNIYTLNELITMGDTMGIGGRVIKDIYVTPRRYGDLREQVTNQALPFDMRSRLYGNGSNATAPTPEIRIHRVYNKKLVPDNKGYAFTQKEGWTYGVMPIREGLITRDNPIAVLEWKIGTIGRIRLGFGVLDDKGLIVVSF